MPSPSPATTSTRSAGPMTSCAGLFRCSSMVPTVSTARARLRRSRAMADHALPVCGHVGLIPSKRTWTGGFKAVGKTLDTAKLVWNQCVALESGRGLRG